VSASEVFTSSFVLDFGMDHFAFHFSTQIDKYDFGKYFYTVVYLPEQLVPELPLEQFPRLRIEAEVNGFTVHGALMPDVLGSPQTKHLLGKNAEPRRIWYLMVSKKVLNAIGKSLGDQVSVDFRIADQNQVEIPSALQDMLEENPRLQEIWDTLTPGKKRGFAHTIQTAKTEKTRLKRLEVLEVSLLEL
jgi:Bacteriocin-protection, YdeI or OmpD-Associated/Domain of unknown function (DUF1905)